jgi:hypothetical protein
MEQSNMDIFNKHTAKIFDFLYAEFPIPSHILTSQFVEDIEDKKQRDVFYGTMVFLEKEGYLNSQGHTIGTDINYSLVVLTSRALAVLGTTPEAIQGNKEPFIQKIRNGLKTGGAEAMKATIQSLISYSVSYLAR